MASMDLQQMRADGSFSPEMAKLGSGYGAFVHATSENHNHSADQLHGSSSELDVTLPGSSTATSTQSDDSNLSRHGFRSLDVQRVNPNRSDATSSARLRLGNLPFVATSDDVRMFLMGFTLADEPNPVRILERQGQSTGRAIVKMASIDEAQKAASALHHSELGKRCIDVTVIPPGQTNNNAHSNQKEYYNNNNNNHNNNNHQMWRNGMPPFGMPGMPPGFLAPPMMPIPGLPFPPHPAAQPTNHRGHHRSRGGGNNGNTGSSRGASEPMVNFWPAQYTERCVRLVGLPYSAREADVVEFLSPISAYRVRFERAGGRLTGKAVVELKNKEVAQQVVQERNKAFMGKRFIEVYPCRPADLQCAESELRIAVRLRGLPFSATVEDVHEFFAAAGLQCTYVALQHAPERNRERREGGWGEAWGLFQNELETAVAHRLYGQRIGDRWIELKVCSVGEFRSEIQSAVLPMMPPMMPPMPMGMPMYPPMGPPPMFSPMFSGAGPQSTTPPPPESVPMSMSMSMGGFPMSQSGSLCGTPPPPPFSCGGDESPMPPMPLTHSIGLALPSCAATNGCQCPDCMGQGSQTWGTQSPQPVEGHGWASRCDDMMMGGIGSVEEVYGHAGKMHLSVHYGHHDVGEKEETVSTSTSDVASDAITTEPAGYLHDKLPVSESRISTHDPYALPPDSEPATPVTVMTPATI